jgi:hypothetical protein
MSNLLAALVPGTYNLAKSDGGNLVVETIAASGGGPVETIAGAGPITASPGPFVTIGISPATELAAGSMSAADKTKLDGITPGAGVDAVTGSSPIVITGTTANPNVTILAAVGGEGGNAGSISNADQTKLNGIAPGAAVSAVNAANGIGSSGGDNPTLSWIGLGDISSAGLVDSISGPSPILITPAVLEWTQGTVAPTLTQAQQANASVPQPMAFACQAPGAAASSAANGTPGGYTFTLPAPVAGGAEGYLAVPRTGAVTSYIGPYPGSTAASGVWLGLSTALSSSNYTMVGAPSLGEVLFQCGAAASGQAFFSFGSPGNGDFLTGVGPAGQKGTCLNGTSFNFGGGVNVTLNTTATVEPTASGPGTLFWSFATGALKWRSVSGWQGNLAAVGAGTLNTQLPFVDTFSAPVRTVSSATPTAFPAYTTPTNTIGWINVRLKSKAATAGTGIAAGDGAFAEYRLGYKNVAGGVTLSTAGLTLLGSVQSTAAALTSTLTAAAVGATVVFSVTNVALATIDSLIDCTVDQC